MPDAEFTLTEKTLVPSLTGCGVQLNQHTFAKVTSAPPDSFADLENKVRQLSPHFIRVFFNEVQGDAGTGQTPLKRESFLRTARLARDTGATINVTWQSGNLITEDARRKSMTAFAEALEHLVRVERLENLRWITIQNEPNTRPKKNPKTGKFPTKNVTPQILDDMYEKLDGQLRERGLRAQIRFMVGDLIRESPDNQQLWFEHMDKHLAGLIDAYSAHIYWDYFNPSKFNERLDEVRSFVRGLPNTNKLPIFVTEYGVRGRDTPPKPGMFREGSAPPIPMSQTNVAAFQQAWFLIRSMLLGYHGTIKWDCSHGKYDSTYTGTHYVLGPPAADGWAPLPMYHLLRLFTATTEAGWEVRELKQKSPTTSKQVVAVKGPGAELTILGLDSGGARKNTAVATEVSYTIGGLTPNTGFTLAVWNRGGGGGLVADEKISASAEGIATVRAPLHAVFALTTKDVSF